MQDVQLYQQILGRESFSEEASSIWLIVGRKRLPTPLGHPCKATLIDKKLLAGCLLSVGSLYLLDLDSTASSRKFLSLGLPRKTPASVLHRRILTTPVQSCH
jgi:hypothetical protein